ncbi:hypothetical protein BDL97_13G023300 [Sphagnum fallax]|nr:hypothetical protein BDL97_13G023300 [Sphagnum fallax]
MSLAYSGGRETTSMTSLGGRILMKKIVRLLQQQLLLVVLVIFLTVETRRVTGSRFCQRPALPGYGCSEHTVQTDDGYLLVLHRLSLIKISRSAPASTASSMTTPTTSDAAAANVTRSAAGTMVERPNVAETENRTATLYLRNTLVPRRRQEPIITSGVASESATNNNGSGTPSLPGAAAPAPTSIRGNPAISGRNNSRKSAAPDCPSPGSTIPNVPPTVPNVPTRRRRPGIGAPVLLMHQEFQNGDIWLRHVDEQNRTDKLLPVMLLENGFDVWVGHQRATLWGNGHVNLTHIQQAYWDWTWDQHAQYDLPAQLLFINNVTHKRIHYIGVSQAATVGAAGATVERTSSLLKSLTVIGLTAYRGYTDSRLLNAWAYYFGRSLDMEYYATGFQNGAFNYSA